MRSVTYSMGVSLDSYIVGPDGGFAWTAPDEEVFRFVTTTEAAGQDAWSLRHAAETGPVQALGWVTVRALALTEQLCWHSLNRGDTAAFTRQAAAAAALREFGVCAGLLRDT
jgi:hypothetical protein